MTRYKGVPRWIAVRFESNCTHCRRRIRSGERCFLGLMKEHGKTAVQDAASKASKGTQKP
jgi:hypothetical protein